MAKDDRRLPPGDDGRTVADMNVEGMPWYRKAKRNNAPQRPEYEAPRRFVWVATLTALGFAAVFCGVMALFVLFCTNVWLR